jgi:hypothetical protein
MSSGAAYRRVHVMVPTELLSALDATVGERRRSHFIVEAIETELRRQRLRRALSEMEGSLANVDIPGWETRESAAAWVRALRDGTLGVQSETVGLDTEAPTSEPAAEDDVSATVAELTELAAQLSPAQLSALVETARDELAHKTLAASSRASR